MRGDGATASGPRPFDSCTSRRSRTERVSDRRGIQARSRTQTVRAFRRQRRKAASASVAAPMLASAIVEGSGTT